MIWCHFNNCGDRLKATFAIRAMAGEMFRIVGATIPT
jgi:hypothetical protein